MITDDKNKIQLAKVSELLKSTYWAKDRTEVTIKRVIENSICFGVYHSGQQIGFARCTTDYATMYWLADVILDEQYRGLGIGKALIKAIVNHEQLRDLFCILISSDTQELYKKYKFYLVNDHFMRRDAE